MSLKHNRKRRFSDLLAGVDELLETQLFHQPRNGYPSPNDNNKKEESSTPLSSNSPTLNTAVHNKRLESSPSEGQTELVSLGGIQMDLLHRRDEEVAELALFYVKTLAKRPSTRGFKEFIHFFATTSVDTILFALKHTNTLEAFYSTLFTIYIRENSSTHLEFIRFIEVAVKHSTCELLCNEVVVDRLLEELKEAIEGNVKASPSIKMEENNQTEGEAPSHWSERPSKKRKSNAPEETPTAFDMKAISKVLDQLGSPAPSSSASVCLRILLRLIFFQNQQAEKDSPWSTFFSVASYFALRNGLCLLGEYLQQTPEDMIGFLSFIEVLTASSSYNKSEGLSRIVEPLLRSLIESGDSSTNLTDAERVAVLRILTNITSLQPDILSTAQRIHLAAHFQRNLLSCSCEDEITSFSLCCAINIIKWEVKHAIKPPRFSLELVSDAEVYHRVAVAMITRYYSDNTADTVLSGYYAIFLAFIFRVEFENKERKKNLRDEVITALTQALKNVSFGEKCAHNPMTVIVAIIQEFIIFQSESNTLTRDTLLELKSLIDVLVEVNGITISED